MQAGTFFTSACVAVMWRIPPPNSSPSFEMSAIFQPVKIDDIFPMQNPEQSSVYRLFILWLHPTERIELFGNILAPPELHQFALKVQKTRNTFGRTRDKVICFTSAQYIVTFRFSDNFCNVVSFHLSIFIAIQAF